MSDAGSCRPPGNRLTLGYRLKRLLRPLAIDLLAVSVASSSAHSSFKGIEGSDPVNAVLRIGYEGFP